MTPISHAADRRQYPQMACQRPWCGALMVRLAALLALVALAVPAAAAEPHPLAGRIWSRSAPQVSRDSLVRALAQAPLVLLGEVHDNAGHHAFRADLIRDVLAARATAGPALPALVFEHVRTDLQPALARFATAPSEARTPEALFDALAWERSGWPARTLFAPLMTIAIARDLPLYAGDVPRATMQAVARRGLEALPADVVARFGLQAPLAAPLAAALLDELEASHCGLMPRTAFAGMAQAQRLRDATLADGLATAARRHGAAMLLAGNGHVRTDRGVPPYLRERVPDLARVAVLLIEVQAGREDALSYVPRDPEGRPAADFVVFTAAAARPDPCVAMRARFGK